MTLGAGPFWATGASKTEAIWKLFQTKLWIYKITHPSHHHLRMRRWRWDGWVILVLWHHDTIHAGNFHRKGSLMLYHLAGATWQVANLVYYNYHPWEDGNKLDGNQCELEKPALLRAHSSFAIILKRKRKLVALLLLSYRCIVSINVLWLFFKVPLVGLQYVIVILSGHTHYLNIETFKKITKILDNILCRK